MPEDTTEYRKKLDRLLSSYDSSVKSVEKEELETAQARSYQKNLAEAHQIIQCVSEIVQQTAHKRIAEVVTRCLESVFDEPYEFQVQFERKRGKTEANLLFVRDGVEIDPMSASGGGVVDVASFALRLACLVLSRPSLRRLLVLDEPFRFVSSEYRPRVKKMIESLSEEMGVQFIMVTHDPVFAIGKVVKVGEGNEV